MQLHTSIDEWPLTLISPSLTIAVALPLTCSMPGKPLIFKAFRASLTLVPAGYIAARDPKLFCDLALRAGHFPAKAIARGDDLFLPLRQAFVHEFSHAQAVVPILNIEIHRVLHADNVHEIERLAVGIGIERIVERHLALRLLPAAKVHEDLILHAFGSISRKASSLFRAIAGNPLDKPDGADRDQVVLLVRLRIVLL